MEDIAFKMSVFGLLAILASLPVMIFVKDRILVWGFIVVGLNFLVQGYVVLKDMGIMLTIMPNFFLFAYFSIVIFIKRKQQQK